MSTLERMPFLAQNAVFRRLAEISDLNTLSKDEQALKKRLPTPLKFAHLKIISTRPRIREI